MRFAFARYRKRERTLRLPDGRLIKITVDDSHTTQQVEEDDALHATVRPRPIEIKVPRLAPPRRIVKDGPREADMSLWVPLPRTHKEART